MLLPDHREDLRNAGLTHKTIAVGFCSGSPDQSAGPRAH